MAQALARMAYSDLDSLTLYNLKGEKKTFEKKVNGAFEQLLGNLGVIIPDSLSDAERDKR